MKSLKLSDVKNFLEGYANYYAQLPPHITEQVELRAFLCKECLDNGKCLICKCSTPQMFYAPSKKDSKKRFAEFFSKDQWDALKNNFDLYYEFFKQRQLSERSTTFDESTGANAESA